MINFDSYDIFLFYFLLRIFAFEFKIPSYTLNIL